MVSLKQYFPGRVMKRMAAAVSLSLILGLVLPVSVVSAQTSAPNHAPGNSSRTILEEDITNNPSVSNGQPQIAVNPEHPRNLVFLSSADDQAVTGLAEFQCFAAYSTDAGVTWTPVVLPLGGAAGCGNPQLAVDMHGIFYIAFNLLGGTAPQNLGVVRSLDGGRTWSDPVATPLQFGASPRLVVDTATDFVYAEASSTAPVGELLAVSVSKDHGLTWSPQAPLTQPSQAFGNQLAVRDGILATATALTVVAGGPMGFQIETTSPVFWVSADNGQTWTSHPVTDSEGNPVPPAAGYVVNDIANLSSTDPIPWVAADPAHSGRFAVMVPQDQSLEVYITNNAGLTWTGPAVIAAPNAFKPWIAYGPTGLLGVVWRNLPAVQAGTPATVNAYSAVSFDGGRSFSAPVQVNHTTEPAGQRIEGGDKYSHITFGGPYAYVTWSDGRTGNWVDGIMSRVPLTLYKCGLPGKPDTSLQGCQPQF